MVLIVSLVCLAVSLTTCHVAGHRVPTPQEMTKMKMGLQLEWEENQGKDPIELSGLVEGDILPPYDVTEPQTNNIDRNAVTEPSKLWSGGIVPYEFSGEFFVLPVERMVISSAMRDIEDKSCIKFKERSNERDFVKIIYDRHRCYSTVGRKGGEQVLSLGFFCTLFWNMGNVYHELLHAVGFHHEHNRPDRDKYVDIMWNNIRSGMDKNFKKRDLGTVDLLDMPYDIDSVMHYSPHAFSRFFFVMPTIISKEKGIFFGRPGEPSEMDYKKLNRLYFCYSSAFLRYRRVQLFVLDASIPLIDKISKNQERIVILSCTGERRSTQKQRM